MTIRRAGARIAPLLVLGALAACPDEDEPPEESCDARLLDGTCVGVSEPEICGETFCSAGVSCAGLVHVSAEAAASGDGSPASPLRTLAEAAARAKVGDCILVAAGTYAGAAIKGGVSVLGRGAKHVTITGVAGGTALRVAGGKGGVVRGLSLGGEGIGIGVSGVEGLTVEEVRVISTRSVGIDARGSARLVIRRVQVKGVRLGAAVSDAGPDSTARDASPEGGALPDLGPPRDAGPEAAPADLGPLVDAAPADLGSSVDAPRTSGPDATTFSAPGQGHGVGILLASGTSATIERCAVQQSGTQGVLVHSATLTLKQSVVERSGHMGVALDCGAGCNVAPALTVTGSSLQRNTSVGLWALQGDVVARMNDIGYVGSASGASRGVEIRGPAKVTLEGNRVHHGAGPGLVLDQVTGSLYRNRIEDNQERGLWLQRIAGSLTLEANEIQRNELVGLGLTGSSGVSVTGGSVSSTRKRTLVSGTSTAQVGDGIQVLALPAQGAAVPSRATLSRIKVESNGRAGVLVDGSKVTLTSSTIAGNETALVVQNAQVSDQTFSDLRDASGAAVGPTTPASAYLVSPSLLPATARPPLP